MPDGASTLYESDFHAWSLRQADALRAAARAGSDLPLDFENLAEEVEDLAKGVRGELRRRMETIVEHLLKLEFSPASGPRAGWRVMVKRSRREAAKLLAENPSVRRLVPELVDAARDIADVAAEALAAEGEPSAAAAVRRHGGAYTEEQVVGDWFPDPPPG